MSAPATPPPDQEHPESDSSVQDSTFGGGRSRRSSTTSLQSSIKDYPVRHGRTYHAYKEGLYKFPNDEQEQERLDIQHELYRHLFDGRPFLAPISATPHNVLDVGTGTGIWAIDFADNFPSAAVIGPDLSPIQPAWVPRICEFQIDDANDPWTFLTRFDFIHFRQLHMFVEERGLFERSFNALRPDAWLEAKEIALPILCVDGSLHGTALARWQDGMMEASRRIDRAFDEPYQYRQWMTEVGFVNVTELISSVPLNPWPEDPKLMQLGFWQMLNISEGLEGFSAILFTEVLGWSRT